MTERNSRVRKYMSFLKKICNFMKKYDFIEKKKWKIVDFFSCDFEIFDGSIGCATKFHAHKIEFVSFYLC